MNDRIKNYLGIAIIIVLFIFALTALSFIKSYSKSLEPSSFRSFTASGEGKVIAIPDVAQFTFSVITPGGLDIGKLQKENTEKSDSAIKFIKSNGVEAKDIKTQSYNLEPRYQRFSCPRDGGPCPPPEIVGYTVRQTILVKVRDFEKIGDLLAGVIQNGANSVSQLFFTIDDQASVENEARTEAIAKAKEKAKAIARAAGFRLGRLLSIEESSFPPPIFRSSLLEAAAPGGKAPSPAIEPGSQEIKVNMILRYEIK